MGEKAKQKRASKVAEREKKKQGQSPFSRDMLKEALDSGDPFTALENQQKQKKQQGN